MEGQAINSDFYLIECEKCNVKHVYTFFNLKDEKKEEKVVLSFSKRCYRCECEDVLEVVNKKEFLVGEIFEKFYDSFISRYYTDINMLETLCLAFDNHESDIFKKYCVLLKVDAPKYSIFLQSEHKEDIKKLTQESLKNQKVFIKRILEFLTTQFHKISETEKMISECSECKKDEKDKDKINVCESCKNKINQT